MCGHVLGSVVGSGGLSKEFKSIIHLVNEIILQNLMLESNADMSHDLTLLRGPDGALFASSGLHHVNFEVGWEIDDGSIFVRGFATVMVQPTATDSDAEAARKTLSCPDLLVTLALGGDHLKEGAEALGTALADETLPLNYAFFQAKRLASHFQTQYENPSVALSFLRNNPVMSPSEAKRIAALMEGASMLPSSALDAMKKSTMGENSAKEINAAQSEIQFGANSET